MEEKRLGKIQEVQLGFDSERYGFHISIIGQNWSVCDFWGTWVNQSNGNEWTVEDQESIFLQSFIRMKNTLALAKKQEMSQLLNVPVEVTFDGSTLKSWRILTEVL